MRMPFLILPLLLIKSYNVWSFPCFLTVVKDNCWSDYNVSVDVKDAAVMKKLFTLQVPAKQAWARLQFDCNPNQQLLFSAYFTPIIWQSEKNKIYPAKEEKMLPAAVGPAHTAWTLKLCFPADFSEVPLPPEARGDCTCDSTTIPEPKI